MRSSVNSRQPSVDSEFGMWNGKHTGLLSNLCVPRSDCAVKKDRSKPSFERSFLLLNQCGCPIDFAGSLFRLCFSPPRSVHCALCTVHFFPPEQSLSLHPVPADEVPGQDHKREKREADEREDLDELVRQSIAFSRAFDGGVISRETSAASTATGSIGSFLR